MVTVRLTVCVLRWCVLAQFHCVAFKSQVFNPDTATISDESALLLSQDLSVSCTEATTIGWMLFIGVPMVAVYVTLHCTRRGRLVTLP